MVWLTIVNGSASGWFGYDQVCHHMLSIPRKRLYLYTYHIIPQGLWSGINAGRYFNDIFPQNQIPATQGIIGSCFALGNFVGCVFTAFVGGRLGRKKTIFIGSTVSGAGVLLQACAYSLPQLIFGRVLNGLGNVRFSSITLSVLLSQALIWSRVFRVWQAPVTPYTNPNALKGICVAG